jgi:LmbE family N-acetylglucosaminyl deacetylase
MIMNILGIGSHPDDLEIGCGGTLAKYAKLGHKVFMCHIANGNMGHVVILPDAQRSAEILGAEAISLDVGDTHLESSDKVIRDKLIEVVRYTKADVIITHNPDDYMRDHMEASRFAYDVSFCTTLPHILTESPYMKSFPPVFYMDTLAGIGFVPTEYVDITDEIETKLEALDCHESQVKWMLDHDHIDFLDFVRTCNKFRGLQCSVPYAEGFRQYAGWPRFRTQRILP